MSLLKAFVGHSFTTDDEIVVNTFLKYLSQIQEMNIGFSWEHAEAAEPKELAEKVLTLMQDKNLFIGICTDSEKRGRESFLDMTATVSLQDSPCRAVHASPLGTSPITS